MIGASFKNLLFTGSADASLTYPIVNLDGAVVDYSLIIGDLNLDTLQATRLQVKGPTILKNLKISRKVDLRDSNLFSLKMKDVTWPAKPEQVWLEGLSYQSVSAGEGPRDWQKLAAWINDSRFDSRNYSQLADYFKHGGYQDRADEVYIQGRRREVMEQWWRPDHLATLIFWDGLAGYGKKPGRTFWLSLIIVLVGTRFFDHRNFDPSFRGRLDLDVERQCLANQGGALLPEPGRVSARGGSGAGPAVADVEDFVPDAGLLSFSQDQRLDPGAHRPGRGLFAV